MSLSLLIHTFNGYQHLWPGMALGVGQHINEVPIYWGTDTNSERVLMEWPEPEYTRVCGVPCNVLFSGPGEWSDRLTRLLHQIPTNYVLYMQEDHWPTSPPPNLREMMRIVTSNNLLRLQLSPINHFYSLHERDGIHFFKPKSKYLVSHQPSIWKKSFLLSCLEPGETPWVNEYEGTKRLNNDPEIIDKIAIYPCNWYNHMCVKGKLIQLQ